MIINHIGYLVKDINKSIESFIRLGYQKVGSIIDDTDRKIFIQFINNNGHIIELVSPNADDSPVKATLKKNGEGPYHICYETQNIDLTIQEFLQEGYIIVQPKSHAVAFANMNVAFMFKKGIGLIELVEKEKDL